MTDFEKIATSLLTPDITPMDFTEKAGFVDSYTEDPDRPSGFNELFLVFDDTVRTEESIDRARRYARSPYLKNTYVKYISGNAYCVYSFWVSNDIKKLYNGIFTLTAEEKYKIAQFWGISSTVSNSVLTNGLLQYEVSHSMPLADYRRPVISIYN
jgi:hypothetical protein